LEAVKTALKSVATTGASVVSEMSLLIGSVGDLHSAVLGGERIGWVFQLRLAVSDSH
jgi:hypothetical protein